MRAMWRGLLGFAVAAVVGTTAGIVPAVADDGDAGHIHGTVTMPDGSPLDGEVVVELYGASGALVTSATVSSPAGEYDLAVPPSEDNVIRLRYSGPSEIVPTFYWPGVYERSAATGFSMVARGDVPRDLRLIEGARIVGAVTGHDGTELVDAYAYGELRPISPHGALSDVPRTDAGSGGLDLGPVLPGRYRLQIDGYLLDDDSAPGFVTLYWNGSAGVEADTDFLLEDGETEVVDVELQALGRISGTATGPSVGGASVYAYDSEGEQAGGALIGPDGAYTIYRMPPGDYRVCFGVENSGIVMTCYPETVHVELDSEVTGIDGSYSLGGSIVGRVVMSDPQAALWSSVKVVLFGLDPATGEYAEVRSDTLSAGSAFFRFDALPDGTYALFASQVTERDDVPLAGSEYWEDARYWADRTDIVIEAGDHRDEHQLGDIVLEPRQLDLGRIDGADRFAVSAELSGWLYDEVPEDGVPVVYVTNGLNYPDALSAGPAASLRDGPVLLVAPTFIPASVAAELDRLNPQRIVVAGGPASVSDAVLRQLRGYVGSAADVLRIGGTDRFEASRGIVREAFGGTGADTVFIATGRNFPDALAATPAAALLGAPVLLVDGLANGLDATTEELLAELGVERAVIAGGPASIVPAIESDLAALLGSAEQVTRITGGDRYAVAAAIADEYYTNSDYAFLATGLNFPDALAGGPLAAAFGAPILLAPGACIPVDSFEAILEHDVQGLILLGGPNTLSPAIEEFAIC